MTPKEKAEELVNKFNHVKFDNDDFLYFNEPIVSKKLSLKAVDEIIDEVYNISHQYAAIYNEETKFYNYTESKELKFWQEVKQEIEAL